MAHPGLKGADVHTIGNKCAEGPYCRHFFLHKFQHTFATEHLRHCFVTHCPQFNFARSATRFTIMSFSLSGLPSELGTLEQFS
jgi:hypothetical protein